VRVVLENDNHPYKFAYYICLASARLLARPLSRVSGGRVNTVPHTRIFRLHGPNILGIASSSSEINKIARYLRTTALRCS